MMVLGMDDGKLNLDTMEKSLIIIIERLVIVTLIPVI